MKKVEEISKKPIIEIKESKVHEKVITLPLSEVTPTITTGTVAAVVTPTSTSTVKQTTSVETISSLEIASTAAAEAEAAAHVAATAKAAEKKKIELDSVIAKKAEGEAELLKQLVIQDRERNESEKKRLALEEEDRERKSKAAEAEASRIATAEAKKIADETQFKLNEEEAKKKIEAETEKKRKAAEEEEKVAASNVAAAATAAAAAADTRSKKAKQKDAMAAKDAANSGDSMLDAYTEPPVGVPSIPASVLIAVCDPEPKADSECEAVDDWEATADEPLAAPIPLVVPVPAASARRSLRPGGGVDQQRLNAGFASASNKPKQQYTKIEIAKLRPQPSPAETERPTALASYASLSKPRGPSGPPGTSNEAGGSQKGGGGGGGGGAAWGRGEMKSGHGAQDGTSRPRVLQDGAPTGQHQHSEEGWSRSGLLPPPPPQTARPAKASKGPSGPRPVKVIVDPIERLSFDVLSILNKITPQTFEKLTGKMCDIPVGTSAELDKMIELVFEKANLDTSFAHLYAEMCATLEVRSSRWAFLQYVHNKDNNQYIWIKDLIFDNILAGPFTSVEECIGATLGAEPPLMQHVESKVEVVELNVIQNILITVS